MWNLRHKGTYLRNRNRLMDIENRLVVAKGEGVGEEWCGRLGLADVSYYIYIEWINNKALLYSTENILNYIQYPMINQNGKEYKKRECIYMYN